MRNKPAPPGKWVIRDHLMMALFEPIDRLRQENINALIEKNTAVLQAQDMAVHKKILPEHFHRSFAYNGWFYSLDPGPAPAIRNKLHPQFEAEMQDIVNTFGTQLNEERLLVESFFSSVLAFSPAPGDWLRVLPEGLHEILRAGITVSDWSGLRTPEECAAFLARHQARFDKVCQRLALNMLI